MQHFKPISLSLTKIEIQAAPTKKTTTFRDSLNYQTKKTSDSIWHQMT